MDSQQISDYNREYYLAHKDQIAIRRTNQRHPEFLLTQQMWEQVKRSQNGICVKCGTKQALSPYLFREGKKLSYIGVCRPCGSLTALEAALKARDDKREKDLEAEAEKFQ